MPRTKGSKNKVKAAGVDYENLIAAAQKEKEEAEAEVAKTNASIEELKAEAKKIQAQEMINQLLANGMSADEILEKLK